MPRPFPDRAPPEQSPSPHNRNCGADVYFEAVEALSLAVCERPGPSRVQI
jgi:hypothetical protein